MTTATKGENSPAGLTGDKYFNLIEHAADGIATIQDGVLKLVNTALTRMSGYDKEELLGMPFIKLLTPQSQKLTVERYQARLAGKKVPQIYEIKAITKDGKPLDIEINAALTEYEGRVADEVIIRDITERKQAQEELREAEEEKSALLEEAPIAILNVDLKGKITYVNNRFESETGYSREEIIGKNSFKLDWFSEGTLRHFMQRMAARLGGKPHSYWETQFKRKDGTWIWVTTEGKAIKKLGVPVGFQILASNITARKKAEEALRESEERYRAILEATPDIMFRISSDGTYLDFKPGKGIEPMIPFEEMMGRKIAELLPPEAAEVKMNAIKAALQSGTVETALLELPAKEGKQVVDCRYVAVGKDEVLAIVRDVTERKNAEEALKESEEKFSKVFSSSGNAICITSLKDGKFIEVNDSFTRFTGYTRKEVIGRSAVDLSLWMKKEELERWLKALQEKGEAYNEEFHSRKKSGEIRVGLASAETINIRGEPCRITVIADITERKQAEEALQEEKNKLQSIVNAMEYGLTIQDKDYNIVYQTEPVKRMHGDHPGEKCYRVYEARDKICDGCPVEKAFRDGESHTAERKTIAPSGEVTFWENTANPVRDAGGNIVSCLEITRNITERKKAEEKLLESERKYRTIFENVSDVITRLDNYGKIVDVNGKVEDYFGYKPEEVIGKNFTKLGALSLKDLPKMAKIFAEVIRGKHALQTLEIEAKHKEGITVPIEVTTTLIKKDGKIEGTVAIVRDITERKQIEEALRQSEKKYKNLAEATSDMIWEANEKGIFTFVSPRIKDILGYEASEVAGKMRTLDLIPKADVPKWLKRFKEINAKRGSFSGFEITHLHKNGTPVILETSGIPTFDNAGNFKGYVGVNKDITERKRMEEQLREKNEQLDAQNEELRTINEELQATEEELQRSQEKLERMFESVTDSISVINLNGIITKVNQRTVEMHGFSSEDEILGKNAFDLVAPRDHERIAAGMHRALTENLIIGGEYTLLKADGSEFPGELSTSALKDGQGKVVGHITIARDVTKRKQAEEREKQLEQELNLAGRLASIGQLAAGVAHEINNPLTGVIGFSHLMMNRNLPNDMKQDLQIIHSEAQRVAKIVENLLIFAHQRKTGREYVAINDIITKVLELRAYEMKVNNIEVETQLDPNLPLTMADTGQLQQVFLNIVLNAEYSMTKAHHKGNLLVKTDQTNGNIRASLTDNGAGISRENMDKIFNPFFTTKEVGKGTGLGLSICHGIITQHDGRIYARSEPGKGATFVIELPIVAEPTQADTASKTKKEPEKPRGAKILVVDDEEAILTFLHRLLTEWGHSVETINSANAALERLKTERYSLILLDIKLPGMSGIELYRHIEEIAPALTRRVMFITGDIMEGTTRDFLEKARVPHITKPLDIEVLKKMINSALNQTQVAAKASG